jgi:hypothetical protein
MQAIYSIEMLAIHTQRESIASQKADIISYTTIKVSAVSDSI